MAVLCPPLALMLARLGLDLENYQLFTYIAGTSTKQDAYTSADESVVLDNPKRFDANGELSVWLGNNKSYKIVIAKPTATDPPGVGDIILQQDNVQGLSQFSTSSITGNISVTSSDLNKIFLVNAASGNITITPPPTSDVSDGFIFHVKKTDSTSNYVRVDPPGSVTIDHSTYYDLLTQDESVSVFKYGSSWYTLNLRINTELRDTAGGLVVNTTTVATPVNYFRLLHSAATNPIKIQALGTDSNININIAPKGTGTTNIESSISQTNEDSRTNTVVYPLTIGTTTSGTSAAGIGTGIKIQAESADESPSDFGALQFAASDVTAGSEDTYFSVLTRKAGAALSEAFRLVSTSTYKLIHSFAGTADRTITWPDSDVSSFLLQRVRSELSTVDSTTSTIPIDNTIPQISEGKQFLSCSITPKSSSSTLKIKVMMNVYVNTQGYGSIALFRDSTANSLNATTFLQGSPAATSMATTLYLDHQMTSGSTSSTTFTVRGGTNTGTVGLYINGAGGAALFGGVNISSITIEEWT